MNRAFPVPLLALALIACLAALRPATAARQRTELSTWWEGPVHYIADKKEIKAFRELETDEERALYVERFWARRDPSPGTITNEYRQLFWERVRDANEMFLDSHKEGWRTDRGKIYVLYGPPTSVEDYVHLKSGGNLRTSPGIIRWLYEGRPGGRVDVDPVVVVAFERQGNEYKLSIDPALSSVFFDKLAVEEETPAQRVAERMFSTPKMSELSVMLDLGKMQEVPPQAQIILERVETIEAYRTRPVESEIDRYVHPDRGRTVVVVTVDITAETPGSTPSIIARFAPADPTREMRLLGEDSFRVRESEGRRLAQGRLVLDPGAYEATVMVVDPVTALPGLERRQINIPEASEQLRLSDVVWARELEPIRYASLASHDEPFQVGPFRVVPLIGDRFRPGDALRLFYEVYGGKPPYRIAYTLQVQEPDESWKDLGQPSERTRDASAQGWALATHENWPAGHYRIAIVVNDFEDRSLTHYQAFTLEAQDAAESE